MVGIAIQGDIVVSYVAVENTVLTAQLVEALGPFTTNADAAGTWTTTWTDFNLSVAKDAVDPFNLLAEVCGKVPTAVTVSFTYLAP